MSTIDPSVRTSRVFEAVPAVFDKIVAATMPAHPTYLTEAGGALRPTVFLFRDPGWEAREYVVVATAEDPSATEWIQSSSASREERFVVEVLIRSMYPETDTDDVNDAVKAVIARLGAIADVVQGIAYDVAAGKPKPIGYSNEITTGRVVSVAFSCEHTTEGVVGSSVVQFGLSAQI